jgi:hypothetical protein
MIETPQKDKFSSVESGLFFIVGCGRSGTSLLRSILDTHPRIALPNETNFFTGISRGKFGVGEMSLQQKIKVVLDKWWITDLNVSSSDLTRLMEGRKPSWRNLFIALLAAVPSKAGVELFGEKTIKHVDYVHDLSSQFPGCRIIQVLRDPRGAFASFRAAKVGSNQVGAFVQDWLDAAKVDRELQKSEHYLRVRFEDLVGDPENTAQTICNFLGIAYDPAMLEFHARERVGFSPEQVHHENTRKPVFTSSVEKWKRELSANQIGLVEACLKEDMQRLGYELTGAVAAFPEAQFFFSKIMDSLSKNLVRRPRQLVKKLKAKKRQRLL